MSRCRLFFNAEPRLWAAHYIRSTSSGVSPFNVQASLCGLSTSVSVSNLSGAKICYFRCSAKIFFAFFSFGCPTACCRGDCRVSVGCCRGWGYGRLVFLSVSPFCGNDYADFPFSSLTCRPDIGCIVMNFFACTGKMEIMRCNSENIIIFVVLCDARGLLLGWGRK